MQKRITVLVSLFLLAFGFEISAQSFPADPAENVSKTSWSLYNGAVSFTASKFNKFVIDPGTPLPFWPLQPTGFVTMLAIMPDNGSNKPFIYTTGLGDAPGAIEQGVVHFVDYDNFNQYGDVHFNYSSESAVSAHWGTEKFLEFTNAYFDWKGFDKQGDIPVNVFLTKSMEQAGVPPVLFDPATKSILLGAGDPTYPYVSLDWIGYAMTRGILDQYDLAGSPSGTQLSYETADLTTAFCNITARCFENWHNKSNGQPINWVMGEHQLNQMSFFQDPPLLNHPKAYLGTYFEKFPFGNHFEYEVKQAYKNAEVLHFWFYLLVNGGEGYVNDDPSRQFYHVKPLDPDPYKASMKALHVLFSAFTDPIDRMKNGYGFNDFRKIALLKAAQNFGPGEELVSVKEAFKAIALGNAVDINCANYSSQDKSGLSFYNGVVNFKTLQVPFAPDVLPNLLPNFLESCADVSHPTIETRNVDNEFIIDIDGDNTYSVTNNFIESQKAISIHWATGQSLDWLFKTLDRYGINGGEPVKNIISSSDDAPHEPYFSSNDQAIHYNAGYSIPSISLDYVGKALTEAIYHFKLGTIPRNQDGTSTSPESEAVRGSLGDIFGRSIYNGYLASQNKPASWVFGGDLFDNTSYIRSFEDPNSRDDAEFYKGNFYDPNPDFDDILTDQGSNNGVLNKWYYLVVNGTGDNPNGDVNEKGGEYIIPGIGEAKGIKLVYNAFTKFLKPNPTFEEFKKAVYAALTDLNEENKKPAIHDAFYAVGLEPERFQDHLKRFPKEGELVYPWKLKVGAQVEFKEESERLFEVSKSNKFNPNIAPVYQFTNSVSASENDGTMYGEVNLEPGQTYFVRSRLSNSGDPREGCAVSPDPIFCELLKGKNKWTITDEFKTRQVDEPVVIMPWHGEKAPAWATPFKWQDIENAIGYDLHVTDLEGTIVDYNKSVDAEYDGENPNKVCSIALALSKDRKYRWTIAARQKLGSKKGVFVLPNGMTVPLTEVEKEAFPNVYGHWKDNIDFMTDIPKLVPGTVPANGQHVPLIGPAFALTASTLDSASWYQFEYKLPYYKSPKLDQPAFGFLVSNVPGVTDLQEIKWAFTPVRKADNLFIPQDEMGLTEWRSFVTDISLAPKPVINFIGQICFNKGEEVSLSWEKVEMATHYHYVIKEEGTGIIVAEATTDKLSTPAIANASKYPTPGKYIFEVSAGYKNTNGQFFFGPKASVTYGVRPPAPIALTPDADNNVPLNPGNNITFKWQPGDVNVTDTHAFSLFKDKGNGLQAVDGFGLASILGNQITVPDLEFNTTYSWQVNNQSNISGCGSVNSKANFKTEKEPVLVVPELGLGFLLLATDAWGFDLGGITYNLTVTNPDGTLGFTRTGLISNSTNQVSYSPESNDPNNGRLSGMSGTYKVSVVLTHIDDYVTKQEHLPMWGYSISAMDIGPLIQGTGPAIQVDTQGQLGNVVPVLNAVIKFEFTYDPSTNTVN